MNAGEDGKPGVGVEIDLDGLAELARRSGADEIYHSISEGTGYRIGVIVGEEADGTEKYSIELLIRVLVGDSGFDFSVLESAMLISRAVQGRGYTIVHLDDGWICCSKFVPKSQVACECRAVVAVVAALALNHSADVEGREGRRE